MTIENLVASPDKVFNMVEHEKIKNLLVEAIGKTKSPQKEVINKEIFSGDVKKKRGRPRKDTANEQHPRDLEVIGEGAAKIVDFNSKKRIYKTKDNILKWNNLDFSIYIIDLYCDEYNERWNVTSTNLVVYMGRIKEEIQKVLGFCDNVALKDYIKYFFKSGSWSDYFKNKKKGQLFINDLRDNKAIAAFVEQYNYQSSFNSQISAISTHKSNKKEKDLTSEEAMKKSYLLGMENFIKDFGVINAVNWLLSKEKKALKEAIISVAKASYSICIKDNFDSIKKSTEKFNPYPEKLAFKDYVKIIEALNKKMNKNYILDITFSQSNKDLDFLTKEE